MKLRKWLPRIEKLLASRMDKRLAPFVQLAATLLKRLRESGLENYPRCKQVLLDVGVFPLRNHYYEPQFDNRFPRKPFSQDRPLPGIDWNVSEQLEILGTLRFAGELADIPLQKGAEKSRPSFHFNNQWFEAGDAEYWYQTIRALRPRKIYEIGSGYSTLMARRALEKNTEEDPNYSCEHVCIEPFERPWLEGLGVTVVRKKVEEIGASLFSELGENDILFIDSSHIIRPEGDVLFEYLELLPSLREGVVVHVHDIFSPRNYPREWLEDEILFWNEQYLLEAFMSHNNDWKIRGALNYLSHNHFSELQSVAPFVGRDGEPGSFYIQRRRKDEQAPPR
jgi:hypothetical protein